MDLRSITDLEGGRLQSSVNDTPTVNDPWDPGVPFPQRQTLAPAPAPPSTSADGHTRHKDRGEMMHRVSKSKRSDGGHGAVSGDPLHSNDEDESANVPFVPRHHASPYPQSHDPSGPHATHLAHMSALHAGSRSTHIASHPTSRVNVNSDPDPSTRIGAASASTQMAHRRARPEDDGDRDGIVEEHARYRSRPRRHSTDPDVSPEFCPPHSLLKPIPHYRSPSSALSPATDSASSQPPAVTERTSSSSPRLYRGGDFGRQPRRSDQTQTQRSLPHEEYFSSEVQPVPTQVPDLANTQSSSIESAEECDQSPTPPLPQPQPVQTKTTIPSLSPVSTSASQPTPDAGGLGMLSDSELTDETVHLRALLGCPPGAPVGLDVLADPPSGEKPNYPLPTLIKLAIYGSPRRRLTLQEIYQALEDRFEWFRQRTDELSWKNSIRHNLSLRKCFLKVQRPITEPGKGSYWMIDLTQGEGNKRVRKRNKKPTKGQLAAQAAAEAYRASARLPGQGDGLRPAPYPIPSRHTHSQLQMAEDDDTYQAPQMQTNFTTVTLPEEPHLPLLHGSTSSQVPHQQSPGISSHQRQRQAERLHRSISADHAPLSLPQTSTHPPPSSHDILGLDANIDPALRVLSKDSLSPQALVGPIVASHHDILSQRIGPTPSMQPGTMQLPMPLNMAPIGAAPLSRGQSVAGASQISQQASANRQAQVTLPHPSLASPRPTYHQHYQQQETGSHISQAAVATSHVSQPQHSSSFLQQQVQPATSLPQQMAAPQQSAALTFTHTQAQPPRLPPMRTLSESPVPTPVTQSPQQQQQQQASSPVTAGFARFAAHSPTTGFAKSMPTFGKPAFVGSSNPLLPPTAIMPLRPLLLSSEDKGKRRAEDERERERERGAEHIGMGDDNDHSNDHGRRSSGGGGGSRRRPHFVPPEPRPGIEYVQRPDGGLVTARRTSGRRHDECTVEWINRLDHGEENLRSAGASVVSGASPSPPSREEDVT